MGTQAHAWIMAFDDEAEAFRKFGEVFPDASTLLIDTYDTVRGVASRRGVRGGDAGRAPRQRRPGGAEPSRSAKCSTPPGGRT